jgi:hypothetical protein
MSKPYGFTGGWARGALVLAEGLHSSIGKRPTLQTGYARYPEMMLSAPTRMSTHSERRLEGRIQGIVVIGSIRVSYAIFLTTSVHAKALKVQGGSCVHY